MRRHAQVRRRGGFTLIEIMIVVILLAILTAVLIPNLGGTVSRTRVQTAADQVSGVMDYCYNAACSTGRVHGLVFSSDGRSYEVVAESTPDPPDPEAEPQLETVHMPGMAHNSLPAGTRLGEVQSYEATLVKTDEDETRVLFFPDGTTEFATIEISDDQGEEKRTVDLNGMSGTIQVENPDHSPVPVEAPMMEEGM